MPSGSVRHALRRVVFATVAVLFAATAAGRPFVAMGMAAQAMDHAARQADDCAHQRHVPSHAAVPCGICCGPACGGCAPAGPVPASPGLAVATNFVGPRARSGEALPRAGVTVRQPPSIGPPSAPVA